ncbi:mammalian cell entry protein (plasmid) [Mycolicibacterium madagascariense]|uniref:Mammalian cell entry protein n=1 Tax=Mycolicibacterium madagascariense TaxID=212765 RepID=A0A7I7XPV2_9MYCO|nr:MlaD family protein [Mycolicibacterium madagascariense]BBZ31256.1 mammalian cell entry protein [Mycolicibacterium madagascariense]
MLTKRIKIQLALFGVIAVVAGAIMAFGYIRVPAMFGVGHYTVTVQLPDAGGLYASGNVTYRGTEVGRVTDVRVTDSGVEAVLDLNSDIKIPSNLDAQVHSTSAIGEQYVALLPRNDDGPALKNGDVIPISRTSVPPPIGQLLDAANRGVKAIPQGNVKTVIDESYTAVGGLGPEISRIVDGSTQLATDARANLDPLLALIDRAQPVLDSQTDSADSIRAWAAHLADLSRQVKTQDAAVTGLLQNGPAAADEGRQLVDRLKPALPILLANLVSIGQVAVVYQPALEQILVLEPQIVASMQGAEVPNLDNPRPFPGIYVNFNLNLNDPPPCTTGFLPKEQLSPPAVTSIPDRPAGDLYCRIPQDARNVVRGTRNLPCITRPGKRAPTVKMCESDEQYVPLNDGDYWKGDPNATDTGQAVPQLPPGTPQQGQGPTPPAAVVQYDPATGSYPAPDGNVYTQGDLAQSTEGKTWQNMMTPPK